MRTFFVHPRVRECFNQLFSNPKTGLASLVTIVTLVSTIVSTTLSLVPATT